MWTCTSQEMESKQLVSIMAYVASKGLDFRVSDEPLNTGQTGQIKDYREADEHLNTGHTGSLVFMEFSVVKTACHRYAADKNII